MNRLDRWLDEAAATERAQPAPDAEAFLARLRPRLTAAVQAEGDPAVDANRDAMFTAPVAIPRRYRGYRWLLRAALIPLAAGLAMVAWEGMRQPVVDQDVIADLELLEFIEVLEPEEVLQLEDPETVQLLQHWELLNDLPTEILERDPENS